MKRIVLVLLVAIGLAFFHSPGYAITIGPSRIEVSLHAGETGVADYYAQNETDRPIHVTVEPENWFKDAYSYGDLSAGDWIKLDIYEFDLQPKEIKKLELRVRIPPGISGELAGQIFFSSAVIDESGEQAGVRSRLGAVLYVAVKGTEIIDAEIRNINVSRIIVENKEKLNIEVTVKNKGNVHLRPTGKVFISGEKDKAPIELDLLSIETTLPNRQSTFYALLDEAELEEGSYNIRAAINYGQIFKEDKEAMLDKILTVDEKDEVTIK